jgi:DHA1 family bicyclomycin/chloramphenicol resistance-like MFS transporter
MKTDIKLPFLTLILMISFASVNAVLFTPALPDIAEFFNISMNLAQKTITWFLIAYTGGQLLYGPLANRYGRKPALYLGISLQIISSLICVLSGFLHEYILLVMGRFFLALGAGVGLKMTFTLVNEIYPPLQASQKISYLMISFAITPALGVVLGSILNAYWGWMSCFYASAVYGGILCLLVSRLSETQSTLDYNALKIKHLLSAYSAQFKNRLLIAGSLLMGSATAFVYVFAALAPFIAIKFLNMDSVHYGAANLLPAMGLILGSLSSAQLSKKLNFQLIILCGIIITVIGVIAMISAIILKLSALYAVFFPMVIIYFGLSFVMANSSSLALSCTQDKAHGSAVMNFINMGIATISVLSVGLLYLRVILLPIIFLLLCIVMSVVYYFGLRHISTDGKRK